MWAQKAPEVIVEILPHSLPWAAFSFLPISLFPVPFSCSSFALFTLLPQQGLKSTLRISRHVVRCHGWCGGPCPASPLKPSEECSVVIQLDQKTLCSHALQGEDFGSINLIFQSSTQQSFTAHLVCAESHHQVSCRANA